MEENKLIKIEGEELQKIGKQIAITNKLLQNSFDYLKWWEDLENIWKKYFLAYLALELARVNLKHALKKTEYSKEELFILQYSVNIEKEDYKMKSELIKYLFGIKKISFRWKEIIDLKPLSVFADLEELQFTKAEIKTLNPLKSLRKLKMLDCTGAKIAQEEIEEFKRVHPNCKVIS
jgi:hypothetical protein